MVPDTFCLPLLRICIVRAIQGLSQFGEVQSQAMTPYLCDPIRSQGGEAVGSGSKRAGSLKETVEKLERDLIRDALRTSQQNQLKAASALGLSRQGLIKKMKRYGIKIQKGSAAGD